MHRWGPRLDWEHLQNWVPGVLGVSVAILLVVVAANSPTQTNSKPAEVPSSQSAALATTGQTGTAPAPSQPAAPQTSAVTDKIVKAAGPPASPAATTGEAAKPPPHDHAVVKAEVVAAPPPVQGAATPDKEPQKAVADATSPQGDAIAGRQVFKKCQACHSLDAGKTILGPSLAGIVGRKSGAEPNFSYSPALKQAALT
jgi:nitrite reductase (NO-forming)